jgi:surfeit locus 1 family protein
MILTRLFSRQWWLTTLLVIVAAGVMIRLGFWQLDRLESRRAFNARVQAQIEKPPLDLTAAAIQSDSLAGLEGMEYRQVEVVGEYDHSTEVALRNQAFNNLIGVRLITPLRIVGSVQSVLVDRGWIPLEDFASGDWSQYSEPGKVEVRGVIRASQTRPEIGWRKDILPRPGEPPLKAWNMVNVSGIAWQVPYPLLPIYIQQAPDPTWTTLPHRSQPKLELSEGSHLGYAIQWFLFAAILGAGYPFYVRREEATGTARTDRRQKYLQPASSKGSHSPGNGQGDSSYE